MDYSVNSGCWGAIFAVPNNIVDNYIKLVSGSTLKVMLFLLRNNSIHFTRTEIACAVGITEENVDEAFCFLEQIGVFSTSPVVNPELSLPNATYIEPQNISFQPIPQDNFSTDKSKEKLSIVRSSANFNLKPTEIAERMENFPDIKNLIDTAQQCLNRQLTPTEMRSFIWIYEYVGLPNTVILMLIQYCISIGKTSARYIETVAIDWQEKGITTFEEAQSETKRLDCVHNYNFKLYKIFGLSRAFTAKEQAFIDIWRERNYSTDMINIAYNKSVDSTNKFSIPYMSTILNDWYNNKLLTIDQITAYSSKHSREYSKKELPISKSKKMRDGDQLKTYTLDNIDQLIIDYVPTINDNSSEVI